MQRAQLISLAMAELGKSRSPKKLAAVTANARKATAARSIPDAEMEKAYLSVRGGHVTLSVAARTAGCSYYRLRDYYQARTLEDAK